MMRAWIVASALALAACHQPESAAVEVLIGGRVVPASGEAIEFGVVVVEKGRIRAAGPQTHVPIPAGSKKIDTTGLTVRAASGGSLSEGEPATLELVDGAGAVQRRMVQGVWQ
jgi:hypothetical protein